MALAHLCEERSGIEHKANARTWLRRERSHLWAVWLSAALKV